ncbi:MAG: SMC-Scp complex subunit ScpB [Phycisphaeraceae bacterium]|nr:SMC-Scp complex subunit ScpB [Phycisphaeraceae bacterium]
MEVGEAAEPAVAVAAPGDVIAEDETITGDADMPPNAQDAVSGGHPDQPDEAASPPRTRGRKASGSAERSTPELSTPEEPCAELPLTQRVEAILLCSDRPLPDAKIASILGLAASVQGAGRSSDAARMVHAAIEELNASYESTGRCFRIEAVAGGRQILTRPALGPLMVRIRSARADGRLSPAALETLAIIAYRQPILRADIESVRGVACGEVLRTLMERRMVRIVGRAEELGRPMLYGTTREFLRVFGLARIDELPKPGELAG